MVAHPGGLPRTKSEGRIAMKATRPDTASDKPERYVFLLDLAEYLGRTSTAVLKKAQRLRINTVLVRRDLSGKAALAVAADDAKRLIDADIKTAEIINPADLMKG